MIKEILFQVVLLITNIIQAITGFAGTVLAMPFSIMLVGYSTARPILNAVGIVAAGLMLFKYSHEIMLRELGKILGFMIVGFVAGLFLKSYLADYQEILYIILGVIVISVAGNGIYHMFIHDTTKKLPEPVAVVMLLFAGLVHGMFVCGGPLVVSYLSTRGKGKDAFRATLSGVWVVLNSIMLADDVRTGQFTLKMMPLFAVSCVVIFIATAIGTKLSKKMSKETFLKISYGLMIVSGVSLFLK